MDAKIRSVPRRRVEEQTSEIRASEHRLAEAQRIAHIGSWERDLETNRINLSTEALRIFGLPAIDHDDNLRRWHEQWVELIHPEDRERLKQAYAEALRGIKEYNEEYRIIRPDGEERIVHSLANIERDESGQPHRVLGVIQDITERKRAEEKVQRLNEELELRVKIRTAELAAKNAELERANKLFVGRELRMVELKQKLRELEDKK